MIKRVKKVISTLIFSVLILIGYYFLNKNYHFAIPCIFHKVTGLYCPGCGTTRLLFSLLNGDIKGAYNYNRLVFVMLPFFVFYAIYRIYLYIVDREDKIICRVPNYLIYVLLFIVILFGILRNTSAFYYLRP